MHSLIFSTQYSINHKQINQNAKISTKNRDINPYITTKIDNRFYPAKSVSITNSGTFYPKSLEKYQEW